MKLLDVSGMEVRASGSPGIPGISSWSTQGWVSGAEALKQCRVDPQSTKVDVWKDLDLEALQPRTGVRHRADLAVAQLKTLSLDPKETWCAAVPSTWNTSQLQVFLGVAQECGIQIAALFPRSLAVARASGRKPGPITVLEWDWSELRVIHVDAADGEWGIRETQVIPEGGLLPCFRRESRMAAAWMLDEHRVDPLHSGTTEQRMFDGWWAWHRGLAESWTLKSGSNSLTVSDRAETLQSCHEEWRTKAGLSETVPAICPSMLSHVLGLEYLSAEPNSLETFVDQLPVSIEKGARWMDQLPTGDVEALTKRLVTHVLCEGVAVPAPSNLSVKVGDKVTLEDGRQGIAIHVPGA